jgi:hypothetical protein
MSKRRNQYVTKSEQLFEQLDRRLARLAQLRMEQFGNWFRKHYPRHHLKVEMYAMGIHLVDLNGGVLDIDGRFNRRGDTRLYVGSLGTHYKELSGEMVERLRQTIADIEEITKDGDYGIPDILEVGEPRVSRFKRRRADEQAS